MKNSGQKIVVYTAAFGKSAMLVPQKKFSGIDFICFSDIPRSVRGWEVKVVAPPFDNSENDRNNRYYKINPHLFFGNYDCSIYIDSNIIVMQLPEDRFQSYLSDALMVTFDHAQTISDPRDCIYEEYAALEHLNSMGRPKDDMNVIKAQIEFFKSEGYPAKNGLIKGGVLIRRHNHPDVIKAMTLWWDIIQTRSKRDQLSFNYVAWKTGLKTACLPGDIRRGNPWFYFAGKGDKNLRYTLIKYKIRKWLKGK